MVTHSLAFAGRCAVVLLKMSLVVFGAIRVETSSTDLDGRLQQVLRGGALNLPRHLLDMVKRSVGVRLSAFMRAGVRDCSPVKKHTVARRRNSQ